MTYMCHSEEQIKELHDKFVKQGYEGAIIRNIGHGYIEGRSNDLMKLKVFDTTEFEVVDVLEAGGNDAGTAIFVLKAENSTSAHVLQVPRNFGPSILMKETS